MKIDFHTHVKLTKPVPFSQKYTESNFRSAKQAGLDAICLTEHYNGDQVDLVYKYIRNNLEKEKDCYLYDGLKIFIGIEIDIAESGHITVVGTMEEISDIYNEFAGCGRKKSHPAFDELLCVIKRPSVIIGGAHPFRPEEGCILRLSDDQIKQLDYVELSGKDLAFNKEYVNTQTKALAERVGLPIAAGSDTHQSFQYGCIYNRFDKNHTNVISLKKAIVEGKFNIEHSEFGARQVLMAAKMKKALKKIHDLGGDYAAVDTELL